MINIKYYDVHIFKNRRDAYSIYVAINHSKIDDDDESIIEHLVETNKLESEEANHVNYVEEVEYEVYEQFNKN